MISAVLPTTNVLYENPAWIPPLRDALEQEGFRVRLVHVNEGSIDASAPPPEGIWMNRISPSSHTRGHAHTVELARQLLYWLEFHGRRVINGLPAFELEMSKLRQDLVLRRHGIRTPRTVLAVGREHLLGAAATFDGPFITKHDQGGKGLGIRLFHGVAELERHLDGDGFDAGPGARVILQEYVSAPEPFITRVEIVGALGESSMVVFAPQAAKHTVTVFTDVDCGYCQRMHRQMADYNRLGITIRYTAFPRAGVGSDTYDRMVSVWCASDQQAAMTDAKAGRAVEAARCDNPVSAHYEAGRAIGVRGTPSIVPESGEMIPGYVEPQELLDRLDGRASGGGPAGARRACRLHPRGTRRRARLAVVRDAHAQPGRLAGASRVHDPGRGRAGGRGARPVLTRIPPAFMSHRVAPR